MKSAITFDDLKKFDRQFDKEQANALAMNASFKNGIADAATNYRAHRDNQFGFSIEIDAGDPCNQMHSGRCWMFAALNVMRLDVMKKLNLGNTELSQNYTLFYDKLEKANYFLENVIKTADEPLDGRLVSFLIGPELLGDGGQWDMFRSLIAKYGVVPKDVMPESYNSSNTGDMNTYLTMKLREYACTLRTMHEKGEKDAALRKEKEKMMNVIYRMLCISLGKPPVKFTWETKDKDGKYVCVENITPQKFFEKYVGWNLDNYVTVINAPTADKPYGKTYTVQYLGNVEGGKYPVKYLNLPIDDLKKLAIAQLKDGKIVWFGSDVGKFSNSKDGLLTLDAFDYQTLFGTDFPMNKAQRLDYGMSCMTHAMAITGVDLDKDGRPKAWKVENSWGKESGKDGYCVMSDAWFDEYTYQILLERKYLFAKQKKEFEQEPVELAPWDPMGSLAL